MEGNSIHDVDVDHVDVLITSFLCWFSNFIFRPQSFLYISVFVLSTAILVPLLWFQFR